MMTREIVFIGPQVDDTELLCAGRRPEVRGVQLNAIEPAPRQMARTLVGRHGLEAVHVIAHGAPGEVRFAAGELSVETIEKHTDDLARIGQALRRGKFMLWSCETGQGQRGAAFIASMKRAPGMDVAAATGLVGASAGGAMEP